GRRLGRLPLAARRRAGQAGGGRAARLERACRGAEARGPGRGRRRRGDSVSRRRRQPGAAARRAARLSGAAGVARAVPGGAARDRYGDGGPRHAYRLRLTPAAPDFALTLAADRLTLAAGKSLDVPVTVQRLNGFAGDVELSVEGLPPGVQAAPPAGGQGGQLI